MQLHIHSLITTLLNYSLFRKVALAVNESHTRGWIWLMVPLPLVTGFGVKPQFRIDVSSSYKFKFWLGFLMWELDIGDTLHVMRLWRLFSTIVTGYYVHILIPLLRINGVNYRNLHNAMKLQLLYPPTSKPIIKTLFIYLMVISIIL